MNKNLLSDKPVSVLLEDKFQRYDFASRIAKTIIAKEDKDCVVIGLYGAWGEGKTSVINFIETELRKGANIIAIKFNPWRYHDEGSLLIQFFHKLANALDSKLKTKGETAGQLLKKYGKLLAFDIPVIGNFGEKVEAAGEMLAEVDLETLKARIETTLIESKRKIVIFIDDIDRLDKAEIHAIFRLVKLTADFSNTTYILSFDEEMVSAAIGERFGSGNQKSGQNFLEKIIQVPLQIPVAQPDALVSYCFELLNKALKSNDINLTEDDARRFSLEFTSYVSPKLTTPRLAIRYSNTLTFSMPLLNGEVNMVDLMLIEAVKVFYPAHYQFIKFNPEFFIGVYAQMHGNGRDTDKINTLKEQLEILGTELTNRQRKSIQNLIESLFPRTKDAFRTYSYMNSNTDEWYKNKRIVSPKYFDKYFSYAVVKGEISDVAFQNFLVDISTQNNEEVIDSIKTLVNQSSPDNFLYKIRSIEQELDWDLSVKLANGISSVSEIFPSEGNTLLLRNSSPNARAVIFIYQLIRNIKVSEKQFELAKGVLKEAKAFEFAFELTKYFVNDGFLHEKIFNEEQSADLANVLLERALSEAGKIPLYDKFPYQANRLFSFWSAKDKAGLTNYLEGCLNKSPDKIMDLLRVYTPTATSSAIEGPFKIDFDKESYQEITSILDKKLIDQFINKVFSEKEINAEKVQWRNRGESSQTDLNIIRQFRYWLEKDLVGKVS